MCRRVLARAHSQGSARPERVVVIARCFSWSSKMLTPGLGSGARCPPKLQGMHRFSTRLWGGGGRAVGRSCRNPHERRGPASRGGQGAPGIRSAQSRLGQADHRGHRAALRAAGRGHDGHHRGQLLLGRDGDAAAAQGGADPQRRRRGGARVLRDGAAQRDADVVPAAAGLLPLVQPDQAVPPAGTELREPDGDLRDPARRQGLRRERAGKRAGRLRAV